MLSRERHQIGALAAVAYCAGDMIGSGIFISPTAILSHTESVGASLAVWIACAFIAVVGALVYIELGTCIRRSGCDFAYLSHAEWHFLAVAFLWVGVVIQSPCVLAIQSTALSQNIVGGLQIYYQIDRGLQYLLEKLIAIAVLALLGFLNMFSLKQWASRFQIVAFLAKIVTTVIIIVTGVYFIAFKDKYKSFDGAFEKSTKNPGEIVLGLYAGLFAYEGWCILNYGLEEIANPKRVLPIAALGGIAISAAVYVLMNVSYFALLTVDEFKTSDAVAVAFSKKALAGFAPVLPFLIALLLLSNLNTTIFSGSRYLLAGAQRKVAPKVFSLVHRSSASPRVAIVTELLFGVVMLFAGDLNRLISYMTFAGMLERVAVVLALFYMRYRKIPMHPDGIRYPIVLPLVFLCINITLLAIPLIMDFVVAVYGIVAVLFGLLVYFVFVFPSKLPAWLVSLDESIARIVARLFQLEPSSFVPDECATELHNNESTCSNCEVFTDCESTTQCVRF